MHFDLVIFDCDGVLIDSELLSVKADRECLAEDGIHLSAEEILERYTGTSLAGMLSDLEMRYGCGLPDFARRHRARLRRLFEADLRAIPGVTTVLDALVCRVCVASSGTPERLRHALSLVGLFERFDPNVFSTTEVARGKPAPDLFLHAARRMGIVPQRCVVVEDSLPGGRGGGCGRHDRDRLHRRQPLPARPRCAAPKTRRRAGDRPNGAARSHSRARPAMTLRDRNQLTGVCGAAPSIVLPQSELGVGRAGRDRHHRPTDRCAIRRASCNRWLKRYPSAAGNKARAAAL